MSLNTKKLFSWSTLTNLLFVLALAALLFSTRVKTVVISSLMKIGFFQANTDVKKEMPAPEAVFVNEQQIRTNLADLKGKVVFINFWATWCPPCIAEMPSINHLYKKFSHHPDVVFLAVETDGDLTKANAFMLKNAYQLPVYSILGTIPSALLDASLPTTVIIDKNGKIVFRHEGIADYSDPKITKLIEQHIQTTH